MFEERDVMYVRGGWEWLSRDGCIHQIFEAMLCSLSVVTPLLICSHPIGIMDLTEWSWCSASALVDSGASTQTASTHLNAKANALFVVFDRFSGRTKA